VQNHTEGSWAKKEVEGLVLPDKRFSKNIISITEHMADNIGKSFSSACGERLRKSAWRLFSKGDLNLLSTHQQNTLQRCVDEPTILVVEDTTDVTYYQKQKQGLGILGASKGRDVKGLNIHSALALTTEGAALGILHQHIWAPVAGRGKQKRTSIPIEEKESIKWIKVLKAINDQWGEKQQKVILIADREADFFEHYAQPRAANVELLVRVREKKRNVYYNGTRVSINTLLSELKPLGSNMIKVWRRPNEKERQATVNYYCAQVTIPPTYKQSLPALEMNLIYIKEEEAEKDAIEWILLTSLAVKTLKEAITIAGHYTCRWVIERFHLILKSGLNIEKLQLDNFTRLQNALQLYALVGWHLLWLYRLGQTAADHKAEEYFEPETVEVLEVVSNKKINTVKEFLVQLGKLGGFHPTKKQPLPGEKMLWVGVRQFIALRTGFNAAKQKYGTG
jgi:Transposase DDE domain/Transposase DNA-binding